METTQILKQAWHTAWRYRALWVLGIVLALTATSWSVPMWYGRSKDDSSGGRLVYVYPDNSRLIVPGDNASGPKDRNEDGGDLILNYKGQADDWPLERGDVAIRYDPPNDLAVSVVAVNANGRSELKRFDLRPSTVGAIVALGIGLLVASFMLWVLFRIARYVSEAALIRLVSEHQETGERRGVWQGIRMGWSRDAWRLFVIDLLVAVAGILAGTLLFSAILAPLPLWVEGSEAVVIGMAFVTGSFVLLAIALLVLGSAALSLYRDLAWRACAVERLGIWAAMGRAYRVMKAHFKDVGLVWVISLAARWAWRLALIPVLLALLGVALLTGSLPALLTGGLTSLVASGDLPVFLALGVGVPIFIVVLVAPLLLFAGLREVFVSALWTLSYRDLRSLESQATPSRFRPDDAGLEAAPAVS